MAGLNFHTCMGRKESRKIFEQLITYYVEKSSYYDAHLRLDPPRAINLKVLWLNKMARW